MSRCRHCAHALPLFWRRCMGGCRGWSPSSPSRTVASLGQAGDCHRAFTPFPFFFSATTREAWRHARGPSSSGLNSAWQRPGAPRSSRSSSTWLCSRGSAYGSDADASGAPACSRASSAGGMGAAGSDQKRAACATRAPWHSSSSCGQREITWRKGEWRKDKNLLQNYSMTRWFITFFFKKSSFCFCLRS